MTSQDKLIIKILNSNSVCAYSVIAARTRLLRWRAHGGECKWATVDACRNPCGQVLPTPCQPAPLQTSALSPERRVSGSTPKPTSTCALPLAHTHAHTPYPCILAHTHTHARRPGLERSPFGKSSSRTRTRTIPEL